MGWGYGSLAVTLRQPFLLCEALGVIWPQAGLA